MRLFEVKNTWVYILNWVLLLNFINLSANFYRTTTADSIYEIHADPIDSVSELVLEYAMDMGQDTIPDTEAPEQKRKIKDFKVFYQSNRTPQPEARIESGDKKCIGPINGFDAINLAKIAPPPKAGFFAI